MSTTLHRKDITSTDITLLARLSRALVSAPEIFGKKMAHELPDDYMKLPVWRKTADGWQFAGVKPFLRKRIGIDKGDFRRICRYLNEKESTVVSLLYRLSMLDVFCFSETSGKIMFRQRFPDFSKPVINEEYTWIDDGFVLERRRALGEFR
ncbi:hypothetical protein OR1_03660 [Geobacter sp. OR-1]|uniref:hypothetical protein n=1 Tax=Geobacter sp. OR-1 TaxID=1266765 RepID=UPI00054235C3|nr:hypothetical protein [Geobacter sp. OR-1]GAM11347.1 hypothetical protein OR1_03660 [Geobacter sp. OR-1]